MIASRLEKQALGELQGHRVIQVPKIQYGKLQLHKRGPEKGKPKMEDRLRSTEMSPMEFQAAIAVMSWCVPKAEAPKDINLHGTIIVRERDPTQRPPGYKRKAPIKAADA